MRILVVDDEEHLRRMMRLTLETAGYDVTEAADGEEALKLFGDGHRFDAILLDQRMPGIDGLETLRRMKRQRSDACVIMVTAYASIELAVDAMKLGASDFVRKPMTPDTLRNAVAAALAKREGMPASPAQGAAPPAPAPEQDRPPIEIWTTNGFFLRRVDQRSQESGQQASDHFFVVRRGRESGGTEVVVSVAPQAVAKIAQQTGRNLSPSGVFWRQQAETALIEHLWNEATPPEAGRLVISRVTGAMVDAAMRWPGD